MKGLIAGGIVLGVGALALTGYMLLRSPATPAGTSPGAVPPAANNTKPTAVQTFLGAAPGILGGAGAIMTGLGALGVKW